MEKDQSWYLDQKLDSPKFPKTAVYHSLFSLGNPYASVITFMVFSI